MTTPYSTGGTVDDGTVLGTLEVLDPYAGMKELLDGLSGDKVTLHVMGGMRVVGKVRSLNHDNGIVTVASGGIPHHVPVHMIVVVEEDRDS